MATIHDSTGYSPYTMLFGRDLSCPYDVISRFTFKNKVSRGPVD